MKNNSPYLCLSTLSLAVVLFFFLSCSHKSGHHFGGDNRRCYDVNSEDDCRIRGKAEKKVGRHTKVSMRQEGGVYFVPIIVNGLNLDFIFDTGASSICISLAEATVMARQGKITDDDIVGKTQFSDANGDVSVGTVVVLRSVQIGDIVLKNVEATIVDNMQAPLLLGQTALAKFGKVTIDYNNNIIEFN